jgi:hypothetical protein
MKVKVTFNTSDYVNSYWKQPKGRGNWFFQIGHVRLNFSGTYTQAKQQVVDHLQKVHDANPTPNTSFTAKVLS